MPRKVDLWESMPPYLKKFREMNLLFAAEQPEFEGLMDACRRTLENMFIQTAHHEGLARFEKLLNIYPSEHDSLDSRRARVMIQWIDLIPYTTRTLKDKIANIQGNDKIEINFSNPYEITITTRLEKHGQVDNLAFLLKAVLPCNLAVVSDNILEFRTKDGATTLYYGATVPMTQMLFLTNDLHFTSAVSGSLNMGAGVSGTIMIRE